MIVVVTFNKGTLFNTNELELGVGQVVDQNVGVQNVFITMQKTPCLFKILTNCNLSKFDELTTLVVPTIHTHARTTSEVHVITW
jgi:hypothetical protein